MSIHVIRLPDVGEGVAEAELVEWAVAPGDLVRQDQVIAAVMTDKATVEIASDAEGRVIWVAGKVGETLAVGSDLIRIETAFGLEPVPDGPLTPDVAEAETTPVGGSAESGVPSAKPSDSLPTPMNPPGSLHTASPRPSRPVAAPSVRGRAREAGIDLHKVTGTGPAGRILHADLEAYVAGTKRLPAAAPSPPEDTIREVPVTGLRRKIAERMSEAKRHIPHITIVEEVDVTALEELRETLNDTHRSNRPKLTVLPFVAAAMVVALREQPGLNARFDDEANLIREHTAIHIGIATQTKSGLMVPVIRNAQQLSLWDAAAEITRLADAARDGTITREELTGSTISITSLGPLGAIATTPIINRPEVAIVGINRMEIRPAWDGNGFVPRKKMNLSSSFDHRVIDGWDAALFVKRLKTLLESPAMIFVER